LELKLRGMFEPITLQVANAPQSDVGLGRARVDTKTRVALEVDVGEVIQIQGKRSTAVRLFRVMQEDEGKGIVRIDGLVRKNLGVSVGDKVEVRKAETLPAQHVAFAPIVAEGQRISFGQGIENFVKRGLLNRPLNKGDVTIVPGIALMGGALPFMVISTSPNGIVKIQEDTVVELREEPVPEGAALSPEELWKRVLVRLLSVIEETGVDLDRLEGTAKEKATNLRDRLMEYLRGIGLQEVTAKPGDAFDPTIHETVGKAPDDRIAEGRIKSIVRNGFRLGEISLQRVHVIVVGNPRDREDLETLREEVRRLRSQVQRLAGDVAKDVPGPSKADTNSHRSGSELGDAPRIEELFLMTRGGLLVAHEGESRSRIDLDILAGQLFITLSFAENALSERDELAEIEIGPMRTLVRHGKFLFLAARVSGEGNGGLSKGLTDCILGIEKDFGPVIGDWDGSEALERTLAPRLRVLLGRGYLKADRIGPPTSRPPAQGARASADEFTRVKVKVVMVGDRDVGKSSLIRHFVVDAFDDKYIQTVGSKVSKKHLSVAHPAATGHLEVEMTIWDILGQKGFPELLKEAYFYGAHGILAVCDVARTETLQHLDDWIESAFGVAGKVPVVFLANDQGLGGRVQITDEHLNAAAQAYNASWFSTSSKTGDNVQRAFQTIAEQIVAHRSQRDTETRRSD